MTVYSVENTPKMSHLYSYAQNIEKKLSNCNTYNKNVNGDLEELIFPTF